MANYSLNISDAVSTGWDYAKKYGLIIAVIIFIVSLLTGGLSNIGSPDLSPDVASNIGRRIGSGDTQALKELIDTYSSSSGLNVFFSIVSILIEIAMYVGLYNLALGLIRGIYNEVGFDAFKLPLATYVKYVVVEILVGIITAVSFMCCIVPYFFVAPRLVFAPLYVIDNPEAGVFEAIKASWGMTQGNTLAMIGLYLALIGIVIVGFLCCCVGVYFAAVVALFATVAAYLQLKGNWA